MRRNVERVRKNRRRLTDGLTRMGFHVYPSQANFVMAKRPGQNLRWLCQALRQRGILVRYFDVPGLQDSLRITVGTTREVGAVLRELKAIGPFP